MRLIDANELKECFRWSEVCRLSIKEINEIIDNAPTVEYPFYQEAYQTGYEEGKNARPQGKCENCDLYFKAMTKEEMKKGGAV